METTLLFVRKRRMQHRSQKGAACRPLLAFAAVVLMCLIFTQSAYAFELDATSGDAADNKGFTWTMSSGTLTVTCPSDETYASYFDEAADSVLTIPSEMGGETVTLVYGNGAGSDNGAIKTLQFPKTVTSIKGTAKQSLPLRLPALTDFEFVGDGDIQLETLGNSALGKGIPCFPSTLERFNAGSVDGCQFDVVIPPSVTAAYAQFLSGTSCTSAYVPSSLTKAQAFLMNMPNLTTVVNESDIWISLPGCPNITECKMLGTYTAIAGSACTGWEKLESFEAPAGITSIGDNAFKGCTSLESFKFGGEELLTIGDNAFNGTASLKTLTLPESVTTIGAGAFANSGIEAVHLPDSIIDIGEGAFANSAIEAIKVPASLFEGLQPSKFTSEYRYGNSTGRTVPLFTATFQSDESGYENTVLKTVDLMSYRQSFLPSFMFAGCTALEEISIPKTVNTIMAGVFTNCTSLKDVYCFGDPTILSVFETQKVTHGLGFDYIGAGSFSVPNGTNPETAGPDFKTMEGITFYGLGISENNALQAYAEKTNCTYVPFAFLGGGGSSADAVAKFGYSNPDNTVSIADIESGETPVITIGYPYDEGMSRTLVSGEDCTATYTLDGREVADFYTPGTYTATIVGDDKSVWGTTTATFKVSAPAASSVPVVGDTGVTANGTLYGSSIPADAEVSVAIDVVTSGEAHDALMAAKGAGEIVGIFESALIVNGEEVHDNFGYLTLTFPVDAKYNGHWAIIYHRHANGAITSEKVVVSNGKVSTTVTDLSTFAVEIGDKVPTGSEGLGITGGATTPASSAGLGATLARTGDTLPVMPLAALAAASLFAVGALALSRRGKTNGR